MAKTPLEIASLARMHTKKAVKTLAAIMNEPHAPYAARVAAAEALLDRGWGKPRQSHEAEITHRYVIEIPALMDNATWEAEALEPRPRSSKGQLMDRREALLLVERLKRRTRDPEVLTLCEYVHGTDVHGTNPGFRRPDVPWTQPAVMPSASCPVCAARRAAETARKKRWRHGRRAQG